MLRERLREALRDAQKQRNQRGTSTLRLILAALKDRDIAARSSGDEGGIGEDAILAMLQKMVKDRRDSIGHYETGGRLELAQQEAEEIDVIKRFLPRQLDDTQTVQTVARAIDDVGAAGLKDMGKVMAALRAKHPGELDFAKASQIVRARLGAR